LTNHCSQAHQLYEQYLVGIVQPHHSEMLLVTADLVFTQQHQLHNLINILGVEDLYFLVFIQANVHDGKLTILSSEKKQEAQKSAPS